MKQQTAVEWLIDNLPIRFKNAILNECSKEITQAIQMEQEQLQNSYDTAIRHITEDNKNEQYMKIKSYSNITDINLLPALTICSSRFYDTGEIGYLSLDIGWLKWGISFVFIDK